MHSSASFTLIYVVQSQEQHISFQGGNRTNQE